MSLNISNVIDPKPDHCTLGLKRYFGSKQVAQVELEDIDPDLEPELILVKRDDIPASRFFSECYEGLADHDAIKIITDGGMAARSDTVVSVSCDSVDLAGYPTELFRRNGLQSRFRFNLCAHDPSQTPTNFDHCTKNLLSEALESSQDEAIRQEKRLYTTDVTNGFLQFLLLNPDLPEEIRALTTDQMAAAAIVLCNRASYSFWDESLYDELGLIVEYETSSDTCLNVSPRNLAEAVGSRSNFEAEAARIIGPRKLVPTRADEQKDIIRQSVMGVREALSSIRAGTPARLSKIEQAHQDVAIDAHKKGMFSNIPLEDVSLFQNHGITIGFAGAAGVSLLNPDTSEIQMYNSETANLLGGIYAVLMANRRPEWVTLESSRQLLGTVARQLPPSHYMLPGNFENLDNLEPLMQAS